MDVVVGPRAVELGCPRETSSFKKDAFCDYKAMLLKSVSRTRDFYYVIEQPVSSKMFQTPEMEDLMKELGLFCVTTWLGLFGHVLCKSTKLATNLPGHHKLLGLD